MKTWDSDKVCVTYGGVIISGFADGSKVKIARNEKSWALVVGTDGEGTRSKSNNRSGKATFMLKGSSKTNDVLTGFHELDHTTNAGALPLLIKDLQGTTLASGLFWIEGMPDIDIGRENHDCEWVLETDKLTYLVGGV